MPKATGEEKLENYTVYRQRYFILTALALANISNAVVWITTSIVATTAAAYYEKSVEAINLFALLFYIMTMPCTILAPYVVNRYGLWHAMHIGAGLNCIGSVIKAIGTSTMINDLDTQYVVSITGQAIASVAQGFVMFTPTKLSQVWFPQRERVLATTVASLANGLGIVIAAGITPLIVQTSGDIPLNNYIWAGLAIITELFTLVFVTKGKPTTPPSRSADQVHDIRKPFLSQLKSALKCRSFVILMNTLGIGIAVFSALASLTQQMLCPLGYSKEFAGMVLVTMLSSGFAGSAVFGIINGRIKYFGELIVIAFALGCLAIIALLEFYLFPDLQSLILISAALYGIFAIGSYPSWLELAVEFTYPIEESMSTAFIYLVAQIEGCLMVIIIPILATDLKQDNFRRNACDGTSMTDAKDYTIPAMVLMGICCCSSCVTMLFMKISYKRITTDDHPGDGSAKLAIQHGYLTN